MSEDPGPPPLPAPGDSPAAAVGAPSASRRPVPHAWQVWANPIFRRYCRSRLRPAALGLSLLLVVIVAGFLFFLARAIGLHRVDLSVVDAERGPIIPLLAFQAVILFFLGTGQVAAGMTAEADEGVLDYQRLAPMTPLAKVIGYLFGLPVREYVLFIATVPFTAWAVWRGQVALGVVLPLYGVFLSSAVLYHLTGLVAGTVVRNRRWAFLVAMGIVFLLYTVIPQLANFGLVYLRYLTLWPVFDESLPSLLPRDAGAALEAGRALFGNARFFGLDLPEAVFTAVSQGVLILTFLVMLWRRWRRTESHLLGKAWAVGLFAWIQVLLLGNALPLIESGLVFPSREFTRRFMRFRDASDWRPDPSEAVAMAGAFGLVSLALVWALTLMITPSAATQLRGWRRARKLGQSSLAPMSDPATAFGWVAVMALLGAGGWFIFARAVVESRWFPGLEVPLLPAAGAFALVFLAGGLGFHALLEGRGARATVLAVVFVGVVPVLVGAVIATISDRLGAAAAWLIAVSPASGPVFAGASVLPVAELPAVLARAVPRAFWFWQGVALLVAVWLVDGLRRTRRARRLATMEEQAPPPGP